MKGMIQYKKNQRIWPVDLSDLIMWVWLVGTESQPGHAQKTLLFYTLAMTIIYILVGNRNYLHHQYHVHHLNLSHAINIVCLPPPSTLPLFHPYNKGRWIRFLTVGLVIAKCEWNIGFFSHVFSFYELTLKSSTVFPRSSVQGALLSNSPLFTEFTGFFRVGVGAEGDVCTAHFMLHMECSLRAGTLTWENTVTVELSRIITDFSGM